jgi:hypothetical protein
MKKGRFTHTGISVVDPDPHQIKIRIGIRIKVINRIRVMQFHNKTVNLSKVGSSGRAHTGAGTGFFG